MEADTSPDINKNKKEGKLEKVNDPEKMDMQTWKSWKTYVSSMSGRLADREGEEGEIRNYGPNFPEHGKEHNSSMKLRSSLMGKER